MAHAKGDKDLNPLSTQIYKSMAQRELDGAGPEEAKQQRYTALIAQAREALYRTMDHLGGNKNHVSLSL